MNTTMKDIYTSMRSAFSFDPLPRKIKITSTFSDYLDTACETIFEDPPQNNLLAKGAGTMGRWDGIPIEIDDTIENEYYEIVY